MKIVFITVGPPGRGATAEAAKGYLERIGRYAPLEAGHVKAAPYGAGAAARTRAMAAEGERIAARIRPGDYVVVLDEKGRTFTSSEFAAVIGRLAGGGTPGVKRVVFVVGGAYGLDETVKGRADLLWSLTPMTLPHELALLVAAEQVYRAFTIMRGEPYSH
ncbi:MAG TPA: 23S rRNA (pseudouridine(1915)-N(3))-methyltransferase RlmH [Deltaproteobacteria bacterium]|nr:23S rRNA (pseudouridine(1915)-N(3))-methyltransferase RlmH [Deltaproteobacteria bacterium]